MRLFRRGPIRAAGGVLVRDGEVLLVHRPKYDDWTFPKGKPHGRESDAETALREVEEETGYRVRLGRELPSTRYEGHEGREKVVRYWLMRPEGQSTFVPGDEVDEIRWVAFDAAAELLTWERDLPVLAAASGSG